MECFVENNAFLNKATDIDRLVQKEAPGIVPALEAIQDLRQQYRETGSEGWSFDRQWRHVASVYGPALEVCELLDEDFLKNKKAVYDWLDKHQGYLVYDHRRPALNNRQATFIDGKPVV